MLTWIEAAILTGYGLVLTASGLLVQAGVIKAAAHADRLAREWHAYLWDPWFLIWGIFVFLALWRSRSASQDHLPGAPGAASAGGSSGSGPWPVDGAGGGGKSADAGVLVHGPPDEPDRQGRQVADWDLHEVWAGGQRYARESGVNDLSPCHRRDHVLVICSRGRCAGSAGRTG